MDLGKFAELLSATPEWFKIAFCIWFLSGASLLVRFLTFPPLAKPAVEAVLSSQLASNGPGSASQASSSQSTIEFSPEYYFKRLQELEGRFLETDEFIKSIANKVVKWRGFVYSVSEKHSYISLILDCDHNLNKSIYITLPLSLKAKAFSLQRGDFVEVTGNLDASSKNAPSVDSSEVIVIKMYSPKG